MTQAQKAVDPKFRDLVAPHNADDATLTNIMQRAEHSFVILVDPDGRMREIRCQGKSTVCSSCAQDPFQQLAVMNEEDATCLVVVDSEGHLLDMVLRDQLRGQCHTPLSIPALSGNEWNYVKECLDTGWVSSVGKFVTRFETEIAEAVGTKAAVATSCGTAALHLALIAAGVEDGDEVIMPTLTFIASGNAVRYLGAFPVFMDVDPNHWQLDPQKLADFLSKECSMVNGELRNKKTDRRVKALMPVHLLGHPCPMTPLLELAREHGLIVVEDSAEALGSFYRGKPAGSLGALAALSFNGNKIITAGGGGMLVTDRQELADRARYLSTQARDDAFEYTHNEVGFNYRLTNLAAAVGVAQLECLPAYVEEKRQIASTYQTALGQRQGVTFQAEAEWARSNFWLSAALIDENHLGLSSRQLMHALREVAIESRPLFQPLSSLPPFAGTQAFRVEVAPRICSQALCLPSSIGLGQERQAQVISQVERILNQAN